MPVLDAVDDTSGGGRVFHPRLHGAYLKPPEQERKVKMMPFARVHDMCERSSIPSPKFPRLHSGGSKKGSAAPILAELGFRLTSALPSLLVA
jgi:hypothetical protein